MQAAGAGNTDVVMLLLLSGADVNDVDETNQSALRWAQKRTQDEVAELLIRAGAKEIQPKPIVTGGAPTTDGTASDDNGARAE
jgi:ankyrin repeat protein